MNLKDAIRTIPNHPKPGVMFRDITTLLGDARAFRTAVDRIVQPYAGVRIDKVAGIEARGFILGGAVAHQLSVGFVPVRKKGKLPWRTIAQDYELEYGIDIMEMHVDAVQPEENVLIVDDLIATGGTAIAAVKLIERLGARPAGASFIIDLPELGGMEKLHALGLQAQALCAFEGH
ncbi:MAG: adenine phosphoribosyltransferase [Hyphomonadaceae bacterium]|nr:adenine phosphoribosyltransferase [Hyphomonadaceae bacterium]